MQAYLLHSKYAVLRTFFPSNPNNNWTAFTRTRKQIGSELQSDGIAKQLDLAIVRIFIQLELLVLYKKYS